MILRTAYTRRPRLWQPGQQPNVPVEVDPDHPIAQGLISFYVGSQTRGSTLVDLAGVTDLPYLGNSTGSLSLGPRGIEARDGNGVTTNGWRANSFPVASRPTNRLSLLYFGRCVGAGITTSPYPALFGMYYGNAGTAAPNYCFLLFRSSATVVTAGWNNGAVKTLASTASIATGGVYNWLLSVRNNNVANDCKLYLNGVQDAQTITSTANVSYLGSDSVVVGGYFNQNYQAGFGMMACGLWNRDLTALEASRLNDDPYLMLRPKARRRVVPDRRSNTQVFIAT